MRVLFLFKCLDNFNKCRSHALHPLFFLNFYKLLFIHWSYDDVRSQSPFIGCRVLEEEIIR